MGCLLEADITDKGMWRLIGEFFHLSIEMHTTDAHLLGYDIYT